MNWYKCLKCGRAFKYEENSLEPPQCPRCDAWASIEEI